MSSKKRSHRLEKLARIYDDEILPVWAQPFGRMLLRDLEIPPKSQILDVACGTGFVTVELVQRMTEGCRLIAIDGSSALLDVARRKVERMGVRGVFFRTESAEPGLSFANDVYDLVVCNLGLADMADRAHAIADFARVTRPGGKVRCTVPLLGTFQELYDIFGEVLLKHDKREALARLDAHLATYPTVEDCQDWLADAHLASPRVEIEEFSLVFKSSREFFFAPLIEHGPLPAWKEIAGEGQEMQDIFWSIKDAIDAYFSGFTFPVTVRGACLSGTRVEASDEAGNAPIPRVRRPEPRERSTSTVLLLDDELIESEIDLESEELLGAAYSAPAADRTPRARPDGTSELDVAELEEISGDGDGIGLDAFAEGRERPTRPRRN